MVPGVDLRSAFQESLNRAITHGQRPSEWVGLGERTRSAIEAVAHEHPDATADHIADAYDAFANEHEAVGPAEPPPAEAPKRLEARHDWFGRS